MARTFYDADLAEQMKQRTQESIAELAQELGIEGDIMEILATKKLAVVAASDAGGLADKTTIVFGQQEDWDTRTDMEFSVELEKSSNYFPTIEFHLTTDNGRWNFYDPHEIREILDIIQQAREGYRAVMRMVTGDTMMDITDANGNVMQVDMEQIAALTGQPLQLDRNFGKVIQGNHIEFLIRGNKNLENVRVRVVFGCRKFNLDSHHIEWFDRLEECMNELLEVFDQKIEYINSLGYRWESNY